MGPGEQQPPGEFPKNPQRKNLRAMKLLVPGGILVTCSCSHFFDPNTFYSMLNNAANDAHRSFQILEKRGAGPDHPVLSGYPKSEYLKCAVLRVL